MAEFNSTEEATGGHEMWPVEEDELIIGHGGAISDDSDGARNTVTVYVQLENGIVTRTLNADKLYTEDMFRSQDPDLCATGPNDPLEDMSETPDLDLHAFGHNELYSDEDDGPGPSSRMSATGPDDPQEYMSETPDLELHASNELYSEEDDGPGPSNRMSDHPTPRNSGQIIIASMITSIHVVLVMMKMTIYPSGHPIIQEYVTVD